MNTWVNQDPRGSVVDKWLMWLLVASAAMLFSGVTIDRSTNAFFSDTRIVSQNNFITASVALNAAPFTAFNFERFVPGDVFVRPVQVTNVAAVGGITTNGVNVNYFMTIKDNFSNCSTFTPKCVDAKGTLSDPVAGLRVVAVRCFSDESGTLNVNCAAQVSPGPSVKSVRLIKGVMETVWPGGESGPAADVSGVVRDWNPTVQAGNESRRGATAVSSDDLGRPIVFVTAGPLSGQPISVKVNPLKEVANGVTGAIMKLPADGVFTASDGTNTVTATAPLGSTPLEVASLLQTAIRNNAGIGLPSIRVQASGMTLTFSWGESGKQLQFTAAPTYFGLPTVLSSSPVSGSPVTKATFSGSFSAAILTASAPATGTLFIGQTVTGTGVPANTKITALGTGTGGAGTYTVSNTVSTLAAQPLVASAYPMQGSDVLRIGGTTIQDLDGNWAASSVATCATSAPDATNGCGAEVIGVPIQTLSNPNCNGLATTDSTRTGRAVPGATGAAGIAAVSFQATIGGSGVLTVTGGGTTTGLKVGSIITYSAPTATDPARSLRVTAVPTSTTLTVVVYNGDSATLSPTFPDSVSTAVPFTTGGATGPGSNSVASPRAVLFSADSHGACFMGGPSFEKAAPTTVFSPRINSQLMAAAAASNPRIVSDIPAQSLTGVGGLAAGETDNIALLVYLPSWSTQRTPDALVTGAVSGTTLTVSAVTSGSIKVGQTLYGLGVPDGLTVTALGNGTGGAGTYTTSSNAVTVASTTISAVSEATPTSLIVRTCNANSVINGFPEVVQVPCGGAGDNSVDAAGKANPNPASYTVAFTAVEPVGVTFAGNNAGAERSSLVPVGQARDVNGTVFAMNAPLVPDNAVLGSNGSGASLQARRRQGRGQGRLVA